MPLQARLGLLFSFCLVLASLNDFSPSGGNAGFHPPGFRRCPRICPQPAHTPPTGLVTRFVGVVPCPVLKAAHRATQGLFSFLLIRSLPFPYGERRGCSQNWAVPVFWIRPQPAHTTPTGQIRAFSQNCTQGFTGASFGFTVLFSLSFSVATQPAGAPGGNSPLHEWARSCKAASRFSQFRPRSTRWSAGFR